MRPLLEHVSRSYIRSTLTTAVKSSCALSALRANQGPLQPWVCQQCRHQSQGHTFRKSLWAQATRADDSQWSHAVAVRGFAGKPILRRISSSSTTAAEDPSRTPRKELPSQEEGRRSHVSKRFSHIMDHLQSNIFIAGQRLNDLTGYSGIEALKKDIEEQEGLIKTNRASLQKAKEAYSASIAQRSASQREVNELLQRKHAWSPQDLERFTSLYRSDHANEQSEAAAQEALIYAERQAEEAAAKLSASILARYHEEQIWSDKIRRMSTWGTWGLMGVNVLLFLVFQIGVEPWRRRRLVKGFEEKVMEALEREGKATNDTAGAVLAAVQAAAGKDAEPLPSPQEKIPSVQEMFPPVLEAVPSAQETITDQEVVPAAAAALALEKVESAEASGEVGAAMDSTAGHAAEPAAISSIFSMMESYKEVLRDLFSERQILLRRVDLTTVALEGAAAGMALVGILAVLLRAR